MNRRDAISALLCVQHKLEESSNEPIRHTLVQECTGWDEERTIAALMLCIVNQYISATVATWGDGAPAFIVISDITMKGRHLLP